MFLHLVFDGVADGPLGVAVDVLATASRLCRSGVHATPGAQRRLRQRVVSLDGKAVRTAAGRKVEVDGAVSLRGLGADDAIVVPGLGAATVAELDALLGRADIVHGVSLLRRAAERGVVTAASCSATFVLAASGALDGGTATTTWWLGANFGRRFPQVTLCTDRMVVTSGQCFTAGASLAHADLILALLARMVSPSLAHTVARYLVLDERPSQARYMILGHQLHGVDPTLRTLEAFVVSKLGRQVSVQEMARATATSPRTLARRVAKALGTTPLRFAQRVRIARAVHLLESTSLSVDDIAARVGYADAAAFRRVFRRETGDAPAARRRRSTQGVER